MRNENVRLEILDMSALMNFMKPWFPLINGPVAWKHGLHDGCMHHAVTSSSPSF